MRKRGLNEFDVREVDAGYVTPCHLPLSWRGEPMCLNNEGYSTFVRTVDGKRKTMRTHNVRFVSAHGPLLDGHVLDHLCRNRACCNLDHLEMVTLAVNLRRGSAAKITQAIADEMRAKKKSGMRNIELMKEYGLSPSHVSSICSGRYWSDGISYRTIMDKRAAARGG